MKTTKTSPYTNNKSIDLTPLVLGFFIVVLYMCASGCNYSFPR
jgi:hypothetical protein